MRPKIYNKAKDYFVTAKSSATSTQAGKREWHRLAVSQRPPPHTLLPPQWRLRVSFDKEKAEIVLVQTDSNCDPNLQV